MTLTILYVGLLPPDWDENVIRAVAGAAGRLIDVRMGLDSNRKHKGFSFCEYQTSADAQQATKMLQQVRIMQPGGGFKKLRAELLKEGFKTNTTDLLLKPVIKPDPRYIPPNVKMPVEMALKIPGLDPAQHSLPQGYGQARQMSPAFERSPVPGNVAPRAGVNGNQPQLVPPKYAQALKVLPPMPINDSPFTVNDRINETLAHIPPPQLIELIGTIKNMLLGPDAARVVEVLQYPNVAPAAAQALMLMGLIDEEVIQEVTSRPNPHLPQPPTQTQFRQMPSPSPPPPQPVPQTYGHSPVPPTPNVNSKWAMFPPHTQQKLAQVNPQEAELIVQVLQLPEHEVRTLPPDKQQMVIGIRSQYL